MAKKSKTPKANALALARRDRKLMECLLPDADDMVTVSIDLGAGEPTVTSHFSQDANYRYACFDGVGKAPYVNHDGVLMIDDIYLMTASISPLGSKVIKDALNTKWNGLSFADQWLADAEVIKSALKKPRQFHKMGCIGADGLIRVKGKGYLPIDKVVPDDVVWDGEEWVTTSGCIYRGYKPVITLNNVHLTPDHKVLQNDGTWQRADQTSALATSQPPTNSWAEVWQLVCNIARDPSIWKLPLYIGRLWARRAVKIIRQFKGR